MYYASSGVKVQALGRLFKALGDDTRLRMVAMLTHGDLCVCHFVDALGLRQSNASRQLAILRAAGIVTARRSEKWVYYRLTPPADKDCARQLRALTARFLAERNVKSDVVALRSRMGPFK